MGHGFICERLSGVLLVLADRRDRGFHDPEIVIRRQQYLQAAHPGRNRDDIPELGRLVEKDRVVFLTGQGCHSAANVAGQAARRL